jgi:UDP-N-acetyl-2-amino-2-deoxyglucuronate dehydrogenase
MLGKPLNVALVGCGRVAYKHLSALDELHGEANLVAICDIDESKKPDKAVPFFLNYHDMMAAHPEIDLIHVLVPTGYHAKVVIDLAPYGKHILTEKPMALCVADCSAMISACEKSGAKLFVVYQNRYNHAVRALRQAFDDDRFGKLVMGTVRVRWCRHQDYYTADNWHGTWALDGGVMSQQASHHLDLLHYFLGEVEYVQCQSATRLLNIEVEDTAAALLRFKNGALGIFEATVAARPSNLEGSLSLLGEKGTVEIGGIAVNDIKTWIFKDKQTHDEFIRETASRDVPNVYGLGHAYNIHDVIRSIRENIDIPSLCDGHAGRRNIKVLTALYESAACDGKLLSPGAPVLHSRLGCKVASDTQHMNYSQCQN